MVLLRGSKAELQSVFLTCGALKFLIFLWIFCFLEYWKNCFTHKHKRLKFLVVAHSSVFLFMIQTEMKNLFLHN